MQKRSTGAVIGRAALFLAWLAAAGVLVYFACKISFNWARDVSNIFVLTTEGAKIRAQTILKRGEVQDLADFFTEEFIQNDGLLHENPFQDYYVTTFSYDAKVKTLPNVREGWVEIEERVSNIRGSGSETAGAQEIPAWVNYRYRVYLQQDENNRWFITEMEILEILPDRFPPTPPPLDVPAPTPTLTPIDPERSASDVEASLTDEMPSPVSTDTP